jgi:integrase
MLQDLEPYLIRRYAPSTVRLRMFWITKFLTALDPLTATTDDLIDFVRSNPEWKPATQQTLISSIRVFYKWANRSGLTNLNPALDLPRMYVPRTRSRIATDSMIRQGIANATVAEEAMLRLGAECGLRVSEIAGMRRDWRDGEWLTVTGKGGKIRTVYIPEELLRVLDEIEATTMRWDYYFPSARPREHIASSTVWRHVRALIELNTHSLRHRAGTSVYRGSGYDIRLAQEFLGHSSPTTTAIYLHIEREQLRDAGAHTRLVA